MEETDTVEVLDAEIGEIDKQLERLKDRRRELSERRERIVGDLLSKQNEIPPDDYFREFPWTEKIRSILQNKFGHQEFRRIQEAALNCIISGTDCSVVMPAGAGKSLIYQLAAFYLQGLVLVITPLTSLMEDQVAAMKAIDSNFPVYGVHVNVPKDELNRIIVRMSFQNQSQNKLLLFITPDKITKSKQFMAKVTKAFDRKRLSLIAIDEAQCCAPNGHDFRSDSQSLSALRSTYPGVPILLLSSTASKPILLDIASALNLEKRVLFRDNLNSPLVSYDVDFIECGRQNVIGEMGGLIMDKYKGQNGIVCCFSVKDAEDVATVLVKDYGLKAKPYHHQLKMTYRSKVHNQWMTGKIQVIVVTNAYGLGINNRECRFVIHYTIPKSLQNYYAESGRCGRTIPGNAHCMFKFQDVFRLSATVFSEKNGLRYLYKMVAYCLDRSTCRRKLIQNTLNEGFEENLFGEDKCGPENACDNCRTPLNVQEVDVTEYIKLFSTIFEELSSLGQRVTGWKLMDFFRKRLNKEEAPATIKEHIGHLIVWSLCEGYLEEKFHFTPYSTISHLTEGPRMRKLIEGRETALFKIYDDPTRRIEDDVVVVEEPPAKQPKLMDKQQEIQMSIQTEQQHSNVQLVLVSQPMPQMMHVQQPMRMIQGQNGQPILVQLVQEQQQPLDQLAVAVQQALQ